MVATLVVTHVDSNLRSFNLPMKSKYMTSEPISLNLLLKRFPLISA